MGHRNSCTAARFECKVLDCAIQIEKGWLIISGKTWVGEISWESSRQAEPVADWMLQYRRALSDGHPLQAIGTLQKRSMWLNSTATPNYLNSIRFQSPWNFWVRERSCEVKSSLAVFVLALWFDPGVMKVPVRTYVHIWSKFQVNSNNYFGDESQALVSRINWAFWNCCKRSTATNLCNISIFSKGAK